MLNNYLVWLALSVNRNERKLASFSKLTFTFLTVTDIDIVNVE